MADTLIIGGRTYTGVVGFKATDDNGVVQTFTKDGGGGGGSSWTLIHSEDLTANVTSTSATVVSYDISVDPDDLSPDKMICIRIVDKAGKRNGYFLESLTFFDWIYDNGVYTGAAYQGRICYRCNSNGTISSYWTTGSTGYGVYAGAIDSAGGFTIRGRYSSTYSLTIDGTYSVEIYTLDWMNNDSPYST